MELATIEFQGETLHAYKARYNVNGMPAITVQDADGFPFMHLTSNLPGVGNVYGDNVVWINHTKTLHYAPVTHRLVDAGVLAPLTTEDGTPIAVRSGYCVYHGYTIQDKE